MKKLIFFFCIFAVLAAKMPIYAAEDAWFDADSGNRQNIYNSGEAQSGEVKTEKEIGAFEGLFAEMLFSIANDINNFCASGGFNLSTDAVILGRLAAGVDASYVQFDLNSGNPYGIIGAEIYVIMRSVIYGAMLLFTVIMLIWALIAQNGSRRAEAKDFLVSVVFYFGLMYALPFICDVVLYVRDVLMYSSLEQLHPGDVSVSLLEGFWQNYEVRHSIINAVLCLVMIAAGIIFTIDYLGTALIQTALFGAIPVLCIRATRNKRIFDVCMSTFFGNLFIPLIDALMFCVPGQIKAIAIDNGISASAADSVTFLVLQLFIIFAIMPARKMILRSITGRYGGAAGGGIESVVHAVQEIAKMKVMCRDNRPLSSENSDLKSSDSSGRDKKEKNSDSMDEERIMLLQGTSMPSIDELMQESSKSPQNDKKDTEARKAADDTEKWQIEESEDVTRYKNETAVQDYEEQLHNLRKAHLMGSAVKTAAIGAGVVMTVYDGPDTMAKMAKGGGYLGEQAEQSIYVHKEQVRQKHLQDERKKEKMHKQEQRDKEIAAATVDALLYNQSVSKP